MKFNYVESDKVAKPQQLLDHKDIRTFVETNPFRKLWECRGTMLNWVLTAPETVAVAKQPLLHEHHDIIASGATVPSCSSCKVFFNKYVEIGNNKVNLLQEQTKQQASSLWTDSRKVRLTASKLSSVPKTTRANPEKFVTSHIYNRFKGCAATRHGQKCEPLALKWFEHHSGLTVQSSGLVLRRDEQYFGASPDGIIDKETIIEIKCPTRRIADLVQSGKYDVSLDTNGNTFLNPKGKNGYPSTDDHVLHKHQSVQVYRVERNRPTNCA